MKISHHSIKNYFFFLWHMQSIMWAGCRLSLPRLWLRWLNVHSQCSTEATYFFSSCVCTLSSCCACWNPNSNRVKRYLETTTFSTCFIFLLFLRAIAFITIFRASMLHSVLINCKSEKWRKKTEQMHERKSETGHRIDLKNFFSFAMPTSSPPP